MRMRWWQLWLLLLALARIEQTAQVTVLATSELTMRTTASVDIQICAAGILSDERNTAQSAILEKLQYTLGRTTAVYLIRQYTTTEGAVCFLYLYQAPSPADAGMTETLLLASSSAGSDVFTVVLGGGREPLQCSLIVSPWRGEDPPLPIWQVSASDLILWGGIAAGILGVCLLTMCCFVAVSRSEDERRARAVLRTDRALMRRLFLASR